MATLRYILPALAVAGRAAASCSAVTQTIASSADAAALSTCSTFSGSIAIATGTTDNIAIDGVQAITGSLIVENVANMGQLSASTLNSIGDSFSLNNVQTLTSLNFPDLENVDTIDWVGLPNLQGLSFTAGVQKASTLSIVNTELSSLDGINLQVIDSMTISNNPYLNDINMQLGNVTTALTIEANGRDVDVEFPNLEWAFNMTFRNCSTVNIPSLASINGSLGFYSNEFTSLSAPNLTRVGSSLSFVSNSALGNVSMPELVSIGGGFQIANNTEYKQITGFPAVTTINGALDFYGNFTTAQLPKLDNVKGAFNLQSSEDITSSCDHFSPLSGQNNVIKGKYTCRGKESHPGGTGTLPDGTNSGSGSSSSSSSPANPVIISGATGVLGVVAAIFGML